MSADAMHLIGMVRLPPEWMVGHELVESETSLILCGRLKIGGAFVWVVGGVLDDECNTNIFVLKWDRGAFFLRCTEATGWALEERIDPRAPTAVREIWKWFINYYLEGKRDVEGRLRIIQAETAEEQVSAVLRHEPTLKRAYENYCRTDRAKTVPLSLDEFRLALGVLTGHTRLDDADPVSRQLLSRLDELQAAADAEGGDL